MTDPSPEVVAATCAACGAAAQGNASIHRDGFGEGPEVDLCDDCGTHEFPTCEVLWRWIREMRIKSGELKP